MSNENADIPEGSDEVFQEIFNDDVEKANLVRADDFSSLQLHFSIRNNTTQTEVRSAAEIEFVQLDDRKLWLAIPEKSCASGHHLILKIRLQGAQSKIASFVATCVVEGVVSHRSGQDLIVVTLIQYEKQEWQEFCRIFISRQTEIMQFLAAARGFA